MTLSIVRNRLDDNMRWPTNEGVAFAAQSEEPVWPRIRAALHAPDEVFTREVYRILIGRKPDKQGYDNLVALLRTGVDRAEVIRNLAKSSEAILGGGDLSWLPRLQIRSPQEIWSDICRLLRSDSRTFTRGIWSLLLYREPTAAELARYRESFETLEGRITVVRALAESAECTDVGADTSWKTRLPLLLPLGLFHALRKLLPLTDDQFVEGLYDLLMYRKPDPAGFESQRALLANGMLRHEMLLGMATGEESRMTNPGDDWVPLLALITPHGMLAETTRLLQLDDDKLYVQQIYDLLLHRAPRSDELAGFRSNGAASRIRLALSLAHSPECVGPGLDMSWIVSLVPPIKPTLLKRLWNKLRSFLTRS